MRNRGMAFIGATLMIAGVVLLLGVLFDFNVWAVVFPLGLILLGVFVILRPRMVPPGTTSRVAFIGEVDRSGSWTVSDEEILCFVGDITIDLTRAEIPPGESTIRAVSFVSDIEITMPGDVGLALDLSSFVTTLKIDGEEQNSFLAPLAYRSEDYKAMDRRVRFELTQFVGDIEVRRSPQIA